MKLLLLSIVAACGVGAAAAQDFHKPVRLKGGGEYVRVESPGWAAPWLADIDRDTVD